jgi:hypothetical protein
MLSARRILLVALLLGSVRCGGLVEYDAEARPSEGGSAALPGGSGGMPTPGSGGAPSTMPIGGGRTSAGAGGALAPVGGNAAAGSGLVPAAGGAAEAGAAGFGGSYSCPLDGSVIDDSVQVDQASLVEDGYHMSVANDHFPGQSFTVGASGLLSAIQVSTSLYYGAYASDTLTLTLTACSDVATCDDTPLLVASTCGEGFSFDIPGSPVPGTPGPGLFDLSAFQLQVHAGEVYRFELSAEVAAHCDLAEGLCSTYAYVVCSSDAQCEPGAFALANNYWGYDEPDGYAGGRFFVDGEVASESHYELDFVTYVSSAQP